MPRAALLAAFAITDTDQDNDQDIVVVGEWMPITFFENTGNQFSKVSIPTLTYSNGWWNCVESGDFDADGDIDLVVGNHGLNSRFSASREKPISLYVNDFDKNNSPDPILTQFNGDKSYPLALRHDLVMQLPNLKKKYLSYHSYKGQTIEDIFTKEQLEQTLIKHAYYLESSLLINDGKGGFDLIALPKGAQFSPIYGLLVNDLDHDGNLDILIGGNLYGVKPEVGRYDANYGLFLKGKGDNSFESVYSRDSGFFVKGQVRDLMTISVNEETLLLVAKNDDMMQVFHY